MPCMMHSGIPNIHMDIKYLLQYRSPEIRISEPHPRDSKLFIQANSLFCDAVVPFVQFEAQSLYAVFAALYFEMCIHPLRAN